MQTPFPCPDDASPQNSPSIQTPVVFPPVPWILERTSQAFLQRDLPKADEAPPPSATYDIGGGQKEVPHRTCPPTAPRDPPHWGASSSGIDEMTGSRGWMWRGETQNSSMLNVMNQGESVRRLIIMIIIRALFMYKITLPLLHSLLRASCFEARSLPARPTLASSRIVTVILSVHNYTRHLTDSSNISHP